MKWISPSEYMEIAERDRSFQYQMALHIYKLINRLSLLKNIESHIKSVKYLKKLLP